MYREDRSVKKRKKGRRIGSMGQDKKGLTRDIREKSFALIFPHAEI